MTHESEYYKFYLNTEKNNLRFPENYKFKMEKFREVGKVKKKEIFSSSLSSLKKEKVEKVKSLVKKREVVQTKFILVLKPKDFILSFSIQSKIKIGSQRNTSLNAFFVGAQ